ncbi:MAG: hypothetical protein ACOX2S_07640 [bacterium]
MLQQGVNFVEAWEDLLLSIALVVSGGFAWWWYATQRQKMRRK